MRRVHSCTKLRRESAVVNLLNVVIGPTITSCRTMPRNNEMRVITLQSQDLNIYLLDWNRWLVSISLAYWDGYRHGVVPLYSDTIG